MHGGVYYSHTGVIDLEYDLYVNGNFAPFFVMLMITLATFIS
jgi:hypothetical protein